ncbi:helix-turn-helix transcriptional regulator [Bacillus cereus]|nr:helix-turn-helix transcriptional regulator [Bacillus cereus]
MKNEHGKTELQKAFKESGLKYHELGERLGVSKSYCYKIINGQTRVYYDIAVKIAGVFGKETSVLFKS